MKNLILIPVVLLTACWTPSIPYVVEHPITPFKIDPGINTWLMDGPPGASKVLTVKNPLPFAVEASVSCYSGSMPYGPAKWVVVVPPARQTPAFCHFEIRYHITH